MNGDATTNMLLWIIALFALSFLMQELQIYRIVTEVENYLGVIRAARERALLAAKEQVRKYSKSLDPEYVSRRIDKLIETRIIAPTSLDPFGLVRKLKHVLLVGERTLESVVASLAPAASPYEVQNLVVLVDIARSLNEVYKLLNHYYLVARRFKSLWLLMQLSAAMPFIIEEVRAVEGAVEAFRKSIPIGDSAGPLVAAFLMRKYGVQYVVEPVKDTIVAKLAYGGKDIYVIKGKGPGGNTGHYDDVVAWVIQRTKPAVIITVDAALRYEGEVSGEVVHGFGVAIGGTGVEKYGIEEMATKYSIPLYAVLIKMAEVEALSAMTEEVYRGVKEGVAVVEELLASLPGGSSAVVVGVGNTVGVPP